MRIPLLVLFACLLTIGQILFKKAALAGASAGFAAVLTNPWLFAALVLYLGATVLWVWILQSTPLSVAYPFAALGFVLVPLAAALFFGEEIGWRYIVGSGLIVSGIIITQT